MQRIVAMGAALATLGVGLGLGSGVAAAATTPSTTLSQPGAAKCAAIQDKIAQVPGIQQRIRTRVDALRRRIDGGGSPRRRARVAAILQPRIDRLEQLSRRLAAQVALADRICARVT